MKNLTKTLLIAGTAMLTQAAVAQVGIGTTNPQRELHIAGTDPVTKTIRIDALNAANNAANNGTDLAPVAVDANGDIVIGSAPSNDWTILGNTGTTVATNFLGTIDNNALAIRTNNTEKVRVLTNGNVGIGETNPAQKLHIAGAAETIRIDAFNSTNSPLENNGIDLSPVAVNANGDLVLGGHAFLSDIELDDDDTTFINPLVYIRTTTGGITGGALDSRSITLTQETLVEVTYNISYGVDDGSNANPALSGAIDDGMNRTVGCAIFINGTLEGANAQPYSNGDSPWFGGTTTYNSGYFTLTGSVYKILPAGTHTINVDGYVIGPTHTSAFNNGTIGAEFGGGYSRIMVIKHN